MKKAKHFLAPVIACVFIQLCTGIMYAWGILRSPLSDAFAWNRDAAAFAFAIMALAFSAGAVIGGIINAKKGPQFAIFSGILTLAVGMLISAFASEKMVWLLYVSLCLIGGAGCGIAYCASTVCAVKWLPMRSGASCGTAAVGMGLAPAVTVSLVNLLIGIYTDGFNGLVSFRSVFLVLAGAFILIGVAASCFIRTPPRSYTSVLKAEYKEDTDTALPLKDTLRTPSFICLFVSMLLISGAWVVIIPRIYDMSIAVNIHKSFAMLILVTAGICGSVGRIALGALSDKLCPIISMAINALLVIAGSLIAAFTNEAYTYLAAAALVSLGFGGAAALLFCRAKALFADNDFAAGLGAVLAAFGISAILFAAIANLAGITAALIAAACGAAASVVVMAIAVKRFSADAE